MSRVLLVQPIAETGVRMLSDAGHEIVHLDDWRNVSVLEGILERRPDTEGMIVKNAVIGKEVIEKGRQLKVIARHGVGLEGIDLAVAAEHGITVTYTPEANSVSVAEHALALILALSRNLPIWDRGARTGDFEVRKRLMGRELEGKILGILGLGKSGKALAERALYGLRMRVVGYTPHPDLNIDPNVEMVSDWREVIKKADYLSLHVPLNPKTQGLIGKTEFGLMKPGACLINCARGPIIKEADLIAALQTGRIAGAGLDVYDPEPPRLDNPLLSMENVILTPHAAAHTAEALNRMAEHAAQGVIEVLSGRPPTWPAPRSFPGF